MNKRLYKEEAGIPALHQAAGCGDIAAVKDMISDGADIDEFDKKERTPLHFAAYKGHTKIAAILINKGADIEKLDRFGLRALHHAAEGGHAEMANLLVRAGARLNAPNHNKQTPLDIAIKRHGKDSEMARVLRAAMAKQDG